MTVRSLAGRPPTLWRYHEVLPVGSDEAITTIGEPITPLIDLPRLAAEAGVGKLYLKDEGRLPTGTFKARGAAVGVSRAVELGATCIAMPTNGNAGAAWATYASRAGIKSVITMPVDAPEICRVECTAAGADLHLVDGTLKDAAQQLQALGGDDWFDAATLHEPYRIEGKKTMAYEILEQLDWRAPDVIIYPTGGGVGLIGMSKAIEECVALGLLDSGRTPRFVAVQSANCAPIVEAWAAGAKESREWVDPQYTVAFGTMVAKALGDFLILDALYSSKGCAVALSEGEITQAQGELASQEGLFVCPEGAATLAGLRTLRAQGWIEGDEEVVLLNTGTGLKYPHSLPVATAEGGRGT